MPRPDYTGRLTLRQVRRLVAEGRYIVDLDLGTVRSERGQRRLFTYHSERSPNLWVRVYDAPKFRSMPLAHLIWTVGADADIPKGWDVHHEDGDSDNNAFVNLFCFHPVDHRKCHSNGRLSPVVLF